jgi:hypothetical protein
MATETQTQITREAPEVEAYRLGLLESAKKLADQRITLPKQMVADMSGLQDRAIAAASPGSGGIGGYQQFLQDAKTTMDAAPGMITGAVGDAGTMFRTGASGVTGEQMAQYMNPYQQAVFDEINRSFDTQSAQAGLRAAQAGAFGGSRAGIQQTEIGRNRAQALAQAQAQNFLQAQQAAERERARQLQAAQGIGTLGLQGASTLGQLGVQRAGIGELAQTAALKDIQTQFELGKQQQMQQQAELEAKRKSDLAQFYEPYQRLGFLSDIYRGAPTSQMTISQIQRPDVSPAQQMFGLGIAGLSAYGGAKQAGLF